MDFAIPDDIRTYLAALDDFIDKEIVPLQMQDDNNRFFVKMIVDVARKQSIKVVATSIERQEEKLAFEHLLVDGLQGYYIAKPKPISTKDEQSTVT